VAKASKSETEKPLTKVQHKDIKKVLEKIALRKEIGKDDDILIFMDFLELTVAIVLLTTKFYMETCMKQKSDRRAFLVKGELSHYQLSVKAYQRRKQELQRLVTNAVADNFKIPHDLWNRSSAFYCTNNIFAPQLQSIVSNFPNKFMVIKNNNYNEMKKDEIYQTLVDVATKTEDIFVNLL